MIKASGGGGGKGMKIVHKEEEFETLFSTKKKSEAQKYFGNDEVYIEKFFQNPRHIEVQILAGKIELFICMKETVRFKEDIKN